MQQERVFCCNQYPEHKVSVDPLITVKLVSVESL